MPRDADEGTGETPLRVVVRRASRHAGTGRPSSSGAARRAGARGSARELEERVVRGAVPERDDEVPARAGPREVALRQARPSSNAVRAGDVPPPHGGCGEESGRTWATRERLWRGRTKIRLVRPGGDLPHVRQRQPLRWRQDGRGCRSAGGSTSPQRRSAMGTGSIVPRALPSGGPVAGSTT